MGAGKMPFANYNELSDSTFKLTLFVCCVHGKNKIKMFPSYLKMESIRNWVSLIFSGKNLVMVHTARGFWNSLPFPNVFPTNVKFPRHTVLTISHIRPDDGLNAPPLTAPLHLYILMLSASHMQCTWINSSLTSRAKRIDFLEKHSLSFNFINNILPVQHDSCQKNVQKNFKC